MKFSEIPYKRPDIAALQESYQALWSRIDCAACARDVYDAVHEWNALRIEYITMENLAETKFTQNVKDDDAKAEKQFYIDTSPTVTEWNEEFSKRLIQSNFRADVETQYGWLFLRRLEDASRTFSPAIKPLLVEEATIGQEYTALLAELQIPFRGEIYNLSGIRKFAEDTDRMTRREASEAQQEALMTVAETLDSLFERLVRVRDEIAQKTGFANFIAFRYTQMGRIEYTARDAEQFRSVVRDTVVPLALELHDKQARRLGLRGVEELYSYDEALNFPDGNPQPIGSEEEIIAEAREMYHMLHPAIGEFFEYMINGGYMDLTTRPNKARGGYCTYFPKFGMPFIFSNFNGTADDIRVLTHEAGHAFQIYCSSREQKLLEYFWPTMEACEIHSMSMEFLTWNSMERFFGVKAPKFQCVHLEEALTFLPYACAIDEFQHWIYTYPHATPKERKEQWQKLERIYLPWRKYQNAPMYESGALWQTQLHVYLYPFYYIDYALAQLCALQFWHRQQQNDARVLEDYIAICRIGGSKPFLEIVREAHINSPFDKQTMHNVVSAAASWLDKQDEQQ
ncbi:MAG: M3 family oligoendopeptidase [Bacteroidota bacterium]|nr:M3 family oligoendopeptidase [Candidatus Kapabacteria bacterium]MDW8219611.1 M3 family oligoendopeptidase [Bacteroidota bacterium]